MFVLDFVAFNQSSVPLRKRVSGESVRSDDVQSKMGEFTTEMDKKVPRIVHGTELSPLPLTSMPPIEEVNGELAAESSAPKDPTAPDPLADPAPNPDTK